MWTSYDRDSSRGLEIPSNNAGGSSQQETLADIEHISTIAGSLASIGSISQSQVRYCANDAGYDTEHTSLNSDFDEAELRRELLRDKWKLLFDMFDPEGFGEILVDEFLLALKSPEFLSQVPMNKRELLLERAKKAKQPIGTGYVTFQDFVNVNDVECWTNAVVPRARGAMHFAPWHTHNWRLGDSWTEGRTASHHNEHMTLI